MGEISNKIAEFSSEIVKQEKAMANLKNNIIQIVKEQDELKRCLYFTLFKQMMIGFLIRVVCYHYICSFEKRSSFKLTLT